MKVKGLVVLALINMCSASAFARTEISLNGGWSGVVVDEEGRTNSLSYIDLPHTWDDYHGCRQLVHGDRHGIAVYRRSFTVKFSEGQRSYLVFEGAGTYLSVVLNGIEICRRRLAGRLVTTLEVTDAIKLGTNVLEVECAHPSEIMDCPWQCGGCGNCSCESPEPFGLFRSVRLVVTGGARIVPWGLHAWHDGDCKTAFIETEIDFGKISKRSVTLHLLAPELGLDEHIPCVNAVEGKRIRVEHSLPRIVRWSLENPKLYEIHGVLVGGDGSVVDSETIRTGFRSIRWPLAGGDDHRFFLNDKPVFIHGTAETDHRQGKSIAFEPEEIDARCAEFQKLGFNLFREGHEPHDLRYLRQMEERGILFWAGFSTRQFTESEAFCSNYLACVEQWIRERRNSPAIVIWGLQNESALPREFTEKCMAAIRRLDPMSGKVGRPVVSCNGGSGTDWNVIQNWSGTYSGYGGELLTYQDDLAKSYQLLNGEYGAWRIAGWHSDPDAALDEKGPWTEEHQARILYEKLMRGWMAHDRACGHVLWTFFSHQKTGHPGVPIDEGYREIDKVGPVNTKGLYTLAGRRVEAWYLYYAYGAHLRAGDLDSVCTKPLSWWLAEGHRMCNKADDFQVLVPDARRGLTYIHRLNCGGDGLVDSQGNVWMSDDARFVMSWAGDADLAVKNFILNPVLGSQGVVSEGVRNAASVDQDLFGTYRYGRHRLRLEFPVPTNAECLVEMYFVEPGSYGRIFDIAINGRVVEKDFNLGAYPERNVVRKSWRVKTGGSDVLKITFPRIQVNQAVVSAVAIATDSVSATRLVKETRKPGYPESAGFTWAELGARVNHRTPPEAKPKSDLRKKTRFIAALPFEDKDGFHRALMHPDVSGDYSIRFKIVKGNPVGKTLEWRFETESWNDNTPSVVFKTGACVITEAMKDGEFVTMPLSTFINAGGFFFGYKIEDDCLSARELKE